MTISRRKVERDLKVSLGILIVGVGLIAVWSGSAASGVLLRNDSNFANTVFLSQLLSGLGGMFVFIGALFAGINWSMLRRQRLGQRT